MLKNSKKWLIQAKSGKNGRFLQKMVKNKQTREVYDWRERRGLRVYQHALKREALLRPLGNVTYFMPPYIITPEQIDHLADVAWEGINIATQD
mgnify:CR=1 FL=1